ncbi:MAG: protoporphyrinogen oxidase [Syntrophotaleaceae bacterium]
MRAVIIGAGISGLATAFFLRHMADRNGIDLQLTVLEKDSRTGGKIHSIRDAGYLCEWGPNGFLDGKPATLELCRDLEISGALQRSNDNARRRFIYSQEELHWVPENAAAFCRTRLISWPGKLRIAMETLVPAERGGEDETLADFCRRRLGPQALEKLIGPMVSGIFAGDPERMSLKSCFPRIHQLEVEYGGLIRAMLRLAARHRCERRAGKAVAGAGGPAGVLTSFAGGIQELTDRLEKVLGGAVETGTGVTALRPLRDGFELQLDNGSQLEAQLVVCAVPAFHFATMVEGFDREAAHLLRGIPYAALQVCCLGFRREDLNRDLNGFGYLVPQVEKLDVLGTLWDSSIFPNRAPDDRVLLRSMLGGATRPDVGEWDEEQVRERTLAALAKTMKLQAEPEFVRVFPHREAIPQYVTGHGRRLRMLQERTGRYPGFFFTGNAFYGIGLNDCVAAANRVAEQAFGFVRRSS